jgi:ATP-dependent helicase HrpB
MNLPIDLLLPEILTSLEAHPNLIIEASPGSGKTTRVPPALLKSAFRSNEQQILILEPRRLAAKYSAHRIANEMGTSVGDLVGYQFRFENLSSSKTRLKFVTEGMFMRLLIRNPRLDDVAVVILDEFHERHIHSDVALSYLKSLQDTHRPELRIILMSATLESGPLSNYLCAPIIKLETTLHPVTLHYLPSPLARHIDQAVREAVLKALIDTSGDLLVFLPGMAEMRRCEQVLANLTQAQVLLLHGELSRVEQDQALKPGNTRKIILSTNLAETSLTIPGVTAVIDSGLHRIASYSWWSGIPALKTRPVSRASAIQRTGRAGRTGPGQCYRLYTKGDFDTRSSFEKPEIMRSDLTQTLLDLKALGIFIPDFPWFENPPSQSLDASEDLLYRLGATEKNGQLTELGHSMSQIAAHPRISRMLLEAKKLGVLESATWLGAALSEGRTLSGNALDTLPHYSKDDALRRAQRILINALQTQNTINTELKNSTLNLKILARAVLKGFPDRVAQKRKQASNTARSKAHEVELLLSAGGAATLEETQATTQQDFFVLLDLQEQQNQNQKKSNFRVSSWIPILEDWLLDVQPLGIEENEIFTWDSERKKVQSYSRLNYGELVLSESSTSSLDTKVVVNMLIKNGLGINPESATSADWILALTPLCESSELIEVESAFTRAKIYADYFTSEKQDFWSNLLPFFLGKSSVAELKQMDWPSAILSALLGDSASSLRDLLPTHVVLPSGRRLMIHYNLTQPPWVQSRLQDFFGMRKGPVLLNGRLPLAIHLLAPNQRPLQVTSDLESFWKTHYPKLRPALSRRYPRHAWPENPS